MAWNPSGILNTLSGTTGGAAWIQTLTALSRELERLQKEIDELRNRLDGKK